MVDKRVSRAQEEGRITRRISGPSGRSGSIRRRAPVHSPGRKGRTPDTDSYGSRTHSKSIVELLRGRTQTSTPRNWWLLWKTHENGFKPGPLFVINDTTRVGRKYSLLSTSSLSSVVTTREDTETREERGRDGGGCVPRTHCRGDTVGEGEGTVTRKAVRTVDSLTKDTIPDGGE